MTGPIIAIGGSEDKQGDMTILKRVLAEAPGRRVHVITTATSFPDAARKTYQDVFARLGITDCTVSYINSRAEANDSALAAQTTDSDVIFFTGGDQLRLTHMLGGTACLNVARRAHNNGAVIAGTSAGAAALSSLMLYSGAVENAHIKGKINAAAGFGFIKNAIIDTHFSQRDRLPRLFQMAAASPFITGIGVDEDTALLLRGHDAEVIGNGTVTITDGRQVQTDFSHKNVDEEFTIENVGVQTLRPGERYNLGNKHVNAAPAARAPK